MTKMNEVVRILRKDSCFMFDIDNWQAMCRSSWGDLLWSSYRSIIKDCKNRAFRSCEVRVEDAKDEKVEEYLH